jgi:hypothetical protein
MRLLFIILLLSFLSVPAFAFDPALNRDALPCARPCQQVDVTKWVTQAGIDFSEKSFARDVFGIFAGIRKPLNQSVNLNMQAGTGFYMGLSF